MNMLYSSTRDRSHKVTASRAILNGLAPDGGLYVPDHIPVLPGGVHNLAGLSYQDTARLVMPLFLTDFTAEELDACIEGAYDSKFDTPQIASLREACGAYYLELFHGPTIAFKDMALSILPYLMTTAARKNEEKDEIVILTATSGDTGKAALAGFADVPGTRILVFYPKDGVSRVQERQMVTQKGENTCVIGIRGNFDDAQSGVKKLFGDPAVRMKLAENGFRFSSANSINIGRLVPQVVYYVYAYGQLLSMGVIREGDPINVTVPTGNFGNILAAYYAKYMGIPIRKLICASNENKVLFDFFQTGVYDRNREFHLTSSPSMDILISSNLERLIYAVTGEDDVQTAAFMDQLSKTGQYRITPQMRSRLSDFAGDYASEEETAGRIRQVFEESGYVLDPHTAVASCAAAAWQKNETDRIPMVIASTASPFKFAQSVLQAIDPLSLPGTDREQVEALAQKGRLSIPEAVRGLWDAPVKHTQVINREEMEEAVLRFLGCEA